MYLLLGNGDGTFRAPYTFTVGSNPPAIIVPDVNGDLLPDVVTANGGSNNASVALGLGDGTFQAARNFAVGNNPRSVASADLLYLTYVNGRCRDLTVTNGTSGTVSVLMGNCDGTFQAAQNFTAGTFPISVAIGDVDKDGFLDLVVANRDSNNVSILFGCCNSSTRDHPCPCPCSSLRPRR